MTERERPAFSKLMVLTFNTYQRRVDEEIIDLYFNLLADYPLVEVTIAVKNHLSDIGKDGSFFPKPADLLRQIQGGKGTQALAAWDTALQGVREVGAYGTVTFTDRLILAVIDRMGGWPTFCAMDEDDKPFKQREFIERYTTYLTRPPSGVPASLAGHHELTNARTGYFTPLALEAAKPLEPGGRKPRLVPVERPALPSGIEGRTVRPVAGMSPLRKMLPIPERSEAQTAEERERQKSDLAEWISRGGKEAGVTG